MSSFKVAAVFSNNCVLQRNKEISIFGEGENGKEITVEFDYKEDGIQKKNKASALVKNNKWIVKLPAVKENKNCHMYVTDGTDSKSFENIAVGEVWLCGGQSNMEFELQNILSAKEHLENDNPNVRFYYTQKNGYMDEKFFEDEAKMCWSEFNRESAKCWSGVGYLFGKRLSEALGVTVGLIGCNWGGTSASDWMSEEALNEDADTKTYMDDYYKGIEGKSEEEQIKEYDEYVAYTAEWEKKAGEIYKTQPNIDWNELQKLIGPNTWPGPINCKNPFRPTGLYKCMLNRVTPYTLRGFLFYQGESDDHKPAFYHKLFARMIKQWRDDWNDESLPMLYVQLPGHRYAADPDYKHWCIIREAQEKVNEEDKFTGMAVIIDCGEFNEIHPKDKEPVGERLYRQAMNKVYGLMSDDEAESPRIDSVDFDASKAVVRFKYAGSGLVVKGDELKGFELAAKDKIFKEAKAVLQSDKDGSFAVVVESSDVKEPKYLRYLWTNYPFEVNLYGGNGLPVAPYRSSEDDDLNNSSTHETQIKQIMEL
jgi:sialate O-acetylesterase